MKHDSATDASQRGRSLHLLASRHLIAEDSRRESYRALSAGRQTGRFAAAATLSLALVAGFAPAGAYAEDTTVRESQTPQTQAADGGPSDSDPAASGTAAPPEAPDGPQEGDGNGQAPGVPPQDGQGGPGGADEQSFDYEGPYTAALAAKGEELAFDGESVSATDADQNAALAENGGSLTIANGSLSKSGDDTNGDNCNFYGLNSVLLSVGEGSQAYVGDSYLSASSEGSNGIFATDSGTVYANNSTIETSAGNARGLDATYGGTIVANKMAVQTQGDHCAGAATDRGGGNVSVANSTLNTAGSGSPLVYSTGDIEVDNVQGTATGSQIAGMEGLNAIMISNSSLTSTAVDKTASDPVANGVIVYQSTSGDAETATGEAALFQAVDSNLKSYLASGSMFYLTNTKANIVLQNTQLDFDSQNADLLLAAGNDANNWGSAGSNGATVNFTGIGENLAGAIEADTISQADVFLLQGTTWSGAANVTENADATQAKSDNLTVNVDGSSTWTVTGDSTVSNLNVAEGGKVVDSSGAPVKIVDANGNTLADGGSSTTVTVTGSYGTDFTTSDANEVQQAGIDRSGFDSHYGTQTTFGTNGAAAKQALASNDVGTASHGGSGNGLFAQIAAWLRSLFGGN